MGLAVYKTSACLSIEKKKKERKGDEKREGKNSRELQGKQARQMWGGNKDLLYLAHLNRECILTIQMLSFYTSLFIPNSILFLLKSLSDALALITRLPVCLEASPSSLYQTSHLVM